MASFSVTSNHFLRNLYGSDRKLATGTERLKVNSKDLVKADSAALRRSVLSLKSYDFDAETEDGAKLGKHLKAFADTYNYTLQSGSSVSGDSRTKSIMNDMKKLREKYGDKLGNYGITFDSKGYMSLSSTATGNVSAKSFKKMMGEDSEFLKDVAKISQKLSSRINYLV